ncbi:MAG: DUF4834 family protein [Sediminicola sp.]
MGFLKTVLIILLVYFFLKILIRWFAPKLFKFATKKAEKHFRERFNGFPDQGDTTGQREGEVIIEKRSDKSTRSSKKVGEYIDFEEIE